MQREKGFKKHELTSIQFVKNYIDQHPLKRKTTDELANLAKVNRNVLQRGFKQLYHIKISEYQLQKRLEEAVKMLEEGRLSKKEIAVKCGYQKPNNFSFAFRSRFNMSPSDWQNKGTFLVPIRS